MHAPPNITSSNLQDYSGPDVAISYNLIVKGNAEAVRRCVDSVYGALYRSGDECVIVDTGSSKAQLKKLKRLLSDFPDLRIIERPELSVEFRPLCKEFLSTELYDDYEKYIGDGRGIIDFAGARNIALKESKNDLVFWIDSDDILAEAEPGLMRKGVNYVFNETPIEQLFMDYEYEFGEDGTCTTILRRERVSRKDGYAWKGRCHETLIPVEGRAPGPMGYVEAIRAVVRHTDARKPHKISDIRNYLILREEYEGMKAAGAVDPRTLFYLGNAARGLEQFNEAHSYYAMFDFRSGSIDDRFAAHYYRSQMYMDPRIKRPFDAMDHLFKCVELKPFDPRGYFGLSRTYAALSRWKECILWYEHGLRLDIPRDQIFSHDPTHVHYHPHVVAAHAFKEANRAEQGLECAKRALAFRPNSEEAQAMVREFGNNAMGEAIHKSIFTICNSTRYPGGLAAKRVAHLICDELSAVPMSLEEQGISKLEPPEGRDVSLPNINFYCGQSGEPWGPFSREKGTGGSEKMVIMLAEALQATGRVNVNVYGHLPFHCRGVSAETGVNWRHWSEFDPKRQRDAMIFWRSPEAVLQVRCPAKQRVIWNHDVQNPERYTDDILSLVDLVQFQSEFHTLPCRGHIPEEKIWVARNAIERLPRNATAPPRNPKQVLYCSSPDRGLLTACEVVRRAQLIDPEIQMVVTYGVTPWARKAFAGQSHRYIPDLGRDASMDEYERIFRRCLDEVGAVVLNRVGFLEMTGLMLGSGVWLYPTRFPEISCMSAMEAQARGMVMLATRFGALEETISDLAFPHLPALPEAGPIPEDWFDAAAEMLVKAVNVPADAHMRVSQARHASVRFDVHRLAEEWLQKLGLHEDTAVSSAAQEEPVPPTEPPFCPDCGGELVFENGVGGWWCRHPCDSPFSEKEVVWEAASKE